MIFFKPPLRFAPTMDTAVCYVQCEGEILLLQRQDGKPAARSWCVPGGKIAPDEMPVDALLRELFEETGIEADFRELEFVRKIYVRQEDVDFEHSVFFLTVESKPRLYLDGREHRSFTWATVEEALHLPLIEDEEACIRYFFADQL